MTTYKGLMNKHWHLLKIIMVEIFYGGLMAHGGLLDVASVISPGCRTRINYPIK